MTSSASPLLTLPADGYALPDDDRELIDAIQRLSLARSMSEVQEIVRHSARRLTDADGATFVLRDGDRCYYADEDAIAPLWKGQRFPMSACISGWVMRQRRSTTIEDIYVDDRIPHDAYRPTFVKSLAMVPIRQLDPVGAIGNYWARRHRPTGREVTLLQALADSTAVTLENLRAYDELEQARIESLQRLALAAEMRDVGTHEHTARVARTSLRIAQQLTLAESDAMWIGQAAPLHDVGKLSVPESILLKPGRLTGSEFEQIKTHTVTGGAILGGSRSTLLRRAEEIARSHHERWDGSGYPHGRRGDEIPLSARIVAVADVFDALTHVRPYKPAWPARDAREEIARLQRTQFDPEVVAAFCALDCESLVDLVAA